MAEDPQPMTLQQRIAALNAAHIGRVPGDPPLPRPKPEVPFKRPIVIRQKTVNNPPEQTVRTLANNDIGNEPASEPRTLGGIPPPLPTREIVRPVVPSKTPPPLPKRQASRPPTLPDRHDSSENSRRGSEDSAASNQADNAYLEGARLSTTRSKSSDRIKAPAWGEEQLPPLPPRGANSAARTYSSERPKYVNRAPSCNETVLPSVTLSNLSSKSDRPSLPPRVPVRTENEGTWDKGSVKIYDNDAGLKKASPLPSTETINKFKKATQSLDLKKPTVPAQGLHLPTSNILSTTIQPPPIPFASRPDLGVLQATKSKSSDLITHNDTLSVDNLVCMTCRDFTGPDRHASLFPRSQVTSLPSLAQHLTAPFPSPTDKARAIFTWLHHNIRYDVDSFFNHRVQPSTPQSTLHSGLAVCEGYAALFANIATYAGLECVVVSGHGKGFGFQNLPPGWPIPPFEGNHAWNAVKIDQGEWKLVDACWGAGHVQGKGLPYVAKFNDSMFTMSNEEFGIKHFPSNKEHFFLPDGRRMSWEEYIVINPAYWPTLMEPPTIFTNAHEDYGIGERTMMPRKRQLSPAVGGSVRFQFGLRCPHWTVEGHTKKGPPPVFMISIHGVDGRNKDHIPLEHVRGQAAGGGGALWYVDVPARELGAPGQTVTLFAVTSFGNRQDARGLTVKEFKEGKGRVGMGFTGVAAWDLI